MDGTSGRVPACFPGDVVRPAAVPASLPSPTIDQPLLAGADGTRGCVLASVPGDVVRLAAAQVSLPSPTIGKPLLAVKAGTGGRVLPLDITPLPPSSLLVSPVPSGGVVRLNPGAHVLLFFPRFLVGGDDGLISGISCVGDVLPHRGDGVLPPGPSLLVLVSKPKNEDGKS